MPLRIVHVSDIHFSDGEWDEDSDQRRELIDDLQALIVRGGPIDAVLVGGDIAFGGQREEYEIARQWLSDLIAICPGIDDSRIWTVPGNHDVDVAVVAKSSIARDFRTTLRTCEIRAIDHELRTRVGRDPASDAHFLPLAEYNEFARKYLSETTPGAPHWQDNSTLAVDGWPVCMTGQNSVLNSDLNDHEDEDDEGHHRLVIGTRQCRLSRENSPIHIAIAHHPPNWVRDWEVIEPHMRRAHLVLYGHEHEYHSAQPTPLGSVQLSAGAVGPERDAGGERAPWIPAYSVITLSRTDDESLRIDVEPRSWSLEATRFVAHEKGLETFYVSRDPALPSTHDDSVNVDDGSDVADEGDESEDRAGDASPLALPHPGVPVTPEAAEEPIVSRPDLRQLAIKFVNLPDTEQLAIGQRLGVMTSEEAAAGTGADLHRVMLRRINEQGLIDELTKELLGER